MPKSFSKNNFFQFLVLIIFVVFFIISYSNKGEEIILAETQTTPSDNRPITILNFGDLMLGRHVAKMIDSTKESPFLFVTQQESNLFQKTDFVVANLEGPITSVQNCQDKPYTFKFKPETTEYLKEAGFDLFSLANNHSYDCFKTGLEDTKKYLKEAGLGSFGGSVLNSSYVVREVDGRKIAFAGIDLTIPNISIGQFYSLIKKLKQSNDYVVVNIHWGNEYETDNSSVQTVLGRMLIDSGADVVFGHHPHVIQPVEVYKNGVIFYSLGNFVFDQNMINTNVGLGVKVTLEKEKKSFELYPFDIVKTKPKFMGEVESLSFCEKFLKDRVFNYEGCSFGLGFEIVQ